MRVLLSGANGLLGRALTRELPAAGFAVQPLGKSELDITDEKQLAETLARLEPDVVINCAAYTQVDAAEANEAEAVRVNGEAVRVLAAQCAQRNIRLVYPSSDYVFAGDDQRPYDTHDEPRPINAYGRSKLAGEAAAQTAPDHLVVRTSWLFGAGGPNFVRTVASRMEAGTPMRVVADQWGRPSYAGDVARAIGGLLKQQAPSGIYHVANGGQTTWFGFAQEIARAFNRADLIAPCTTQEFPRPARRPAYSVLDTTATDELIGELPAWEAAVARAIHDHDY